GDPGTGPDQHQPPHPSRERQRHVQGEPAPHRVARKLEGPGRQRVDVTHDRRQRDRAHGRGRAVPADVGGHRPVAFWQRRHDPVPACPRVGEAVEQDEVGRHRPIMTATDTYLLLRAFCDELARCGVEHACTSPGSRNTPILLSLAREPRIRCWSHIDERCAAFFALGAAKASRRPVAITCTSGTAAANYTPAVIEAWHARVPLIILTADRPPELRDVGAGQAIDQLKLYGDAVKWFCEVGVDTATPDALRWIRQLACRAYWTTLAGRPGPVHLNFPLREPLVLEDPLPEDPVLGRADGRPWVQRAPQASAAPIAEARGTLPARGIIVAGRSERADGLGGAAALAAERLGWPLLADPLSGARHGATAIATYDLLLRDDGFTRRVAPELVVRVGDLPTSKPLRAWLASLNDAQQLALDPEHAWQDPSAAVSEID